MSSGLADTGTGIARILDKERDASGRGCSRSQEANGWLTWRAAEGRAQGSHISKQHQPKGQRQAHLNTKDTSRFGGSERRRSMEEQEVITKKASSGSEFWK